MRPVDPRGFTLVELLVALALLGVVSVGLHRVLVGTQRIYQDQAQRMDLHQNLRAAVALLPAELRELDAYDGDILAMSADFIHVRALRQLAFLCAAPLLPAPGGIVTFTVRAEPLFAQRDFQVSTDSIMVYYEGDRATRADDGWVLGRPTAIAPTSCPDGHPGRRITASLFFDPDPPGAPCCPQLNAIGRIGTGAPLRGFETVTYLRYTAADGRTYIGMRQGASLQPLIGPVTSDGFRLSYFDSAGAVTANPTAVAATEILVIGETAQPVRRADGTLGYRQDTVRTRVAMRNNRRW